MRNNRRRRKSSLPFLLLNIIISAATTLIVLWLWNRTHSAGVNLDSPPKEQSQTLQALVITPSMQPPLPALDEPVFEIENVYGVGDIENEVIILRRVGEEQEI